MASYKPRPMILLVGGVSTAAAAGVLAANMDSSRVVHLAIPAVGLGLVALALIALGVGSLMAQRRGEDDSKPEDYRHTYRVFGAVLFVLVAAVVARGLAIPSSYGEYGAYRGKAVAKAMKASPRHQGKATCAGAKCHPKHAKLHAKDAHLRVQCETCHGPADKHRAAPTTAKMLLPKGKAACLVCHQHLDARPGSFAQIDWKKHYKFVGVKDHSIDCTKCHNPHEPLFMDRDLRTARLHPVVHRCRDCHVGKKRDPSTTRPAGHPAIFGCEHCHKGVVADFKKRKHTKVRCTTCHIFFKQSDFAGRIIRDADPRFCLLCHRKAPFRAKSAPPGITWPSHREEMGGEGKERCVDCHQEDIHLTSKGAAKPASAATESAPPKGDENAK